MSLKAELETWVDALKAYDAEDFEKALELFGRIADSSKILTNIGLIYATLGEHELAVDNFNNATRLDSFLAVAYFQCGVSNFLMQRYEYAYKDFEEAYLYLRQNQDIKYEQLGLKFTLYSAEVLFNRGLTQIYLNRADAGLADLRLAAGEKITPEHDVIDDCIRDAGEGYTVFSIPVGVLYRPPENKVRNTKAKDYLGRAKLVAATDARDLGTGFSGASLRDAGMLPSGAPLEDSALAAAARAQLNVNQQQPASAPAPKTARSFNVGPIDLPPPSLSRGPASPPQALSPRGGLASAPVVRVDPTSPTGGARLERAGTQVRVAPPAGGLRRGASVGGGGPGMRREPSMNMRTPALSTPGNGARAPARLTEIYDDYIGLGDDAPPPPLPTDASARVANWAQAQRAPTVRRTATNASSAPSGMRRRPTATSMRTPRSARAVSTYEEEEEGYGSGEYDDGFEMVKIKVKLHYRDDTRGMAVSPETPYPDFMSRVNAKFGARLALRFRDEDGAMISLKDESDYDLAVETARESARGRPEGKLEVWCDDA